jgi:hypothetical protein
MAFFLSADGFECEFIFIEKVIPRLFLKLKKISYFNKIWPLLSLYY